jgi:hypothetical protein
MARTLGTNFEAELAAGEVQPFFAVLMEFDGGDMRVWNGYGDITIDGETYVGSADFLNLGEITETSEVQAAGVSVALTGLDSSLVATALDEAYQGRPLKIFFGFLDNTGTIIDTPYTIFSGRMDVMTIEDAGATANINVTAESRLIDLDRSRARRFTSEDQKIDYPNDKGLEMVASLQDTVIIWG